MSAERTAAQRNRYLPPEQEAERDARITAEVAKWPPLTATEKVKLRALLAPQPERSDGAA